MVTSNGTYVDGGVFLFLMFLVICHFQLEPVLGD